MGLASSEPGVVLDPFMGSGSTLVAAHRRGYKAIGVEMEERHCEVAAKRLRAELTLPRDVALPLGEGEAA